ncbi:olfactory receptor 11A1-like [Odontesthes bonariensis]|uniref:olfactory receptor 11A1-like n=1 Tax=Odontesthes bonariensis TaxID=219752 RepID=UPI003F58FFFD
MMNVTSLTLDGLQQLSEHRLLLFLLFLLLYVFIVCSDGLVLLVICSQRSLHRPMFVLVAALLFNSLVGSTAVYPRLLWELRWGGGSVQVSVSACVCQAWVVYTLGASAFMLLAAMALDRYVSICRPLRYAALVSPRAVAALLLFCWLLPAALIGVAALLAARLPLCRARLSRLYCDIYSFTWLSCGGRAALLSEAYALLANTAIILLPIAFVLFSYGSILRVCLRRSRTFSTKALSTCLPHLLVFINYSASVLVELLQRRLQADSPAAASVLASLLVVLFPTVFNPLVYGLKLSAVSGQLRRLLGCQRRL